MTSEEANEAIDEALSSHGQLDSIDESYFLDPKFEGIAWLPTYTRRIGNRVWAIELYRGDIVPDSTLEAMVRTRQADHSIQPALFVPEQPHEHLIPHCRNHSIALIVRRADEYEALVFPGAAEVGGPVIRVPDWLVTRVGDLRNLSTPFRSALRRFGNRFNNLVNAGGATDEAQEREVRRTIAGLFRADQRFSGDFSPVNFLRFFEQTVLLKGRDHFFHTFNNFLLGCTVLDQCRNAVNEFRQACYLGGHWSPEYVWLMTVLFHDVGYPIQKFSETYEMIFGVRAVTEEQALAERKQAWSSPPYVVARTQLVSLYDHLTQATIDSDWAADLFPLEEGHPLDRAFGESFLKSSHGAASSMRMLAGFFRSAPTTSHRQFLMHNAFMAGLSIPFHDWPVRKYLREFGIEHIRTSRFPFASLLMFIDSVQEDRRGEVQEPDVLRDLIVNENNIRADLNLDLLSSDRIAEKQREARDVKSFLTEDLLHFTYPAELS